MQTILITDFDFSTFNDSLLSTASEDNTIKLWIIPDEGIIHDIAECKAQNRAHSKKIILTKFHPSFDYTLASCGSDNTVRIWDIFQQRCALTYEEAKGLTTVKKLTLFKNRQNLKRNQLKNKCIYKFNLFLTLLYLLYQVLGYQQLIENNDLVNL